MCVQRVFYHCIVYNTWFVGSLHNILTVCVGVSGVTSCHWLVDLRSAFLLDRAVHAQSHKLYKLLHYKIHRCSVFTLVPLLSILPHSTNVYQSEFATIYYWKLENVFIWIDAVGGLLPPNHAVDEKRIKLCRITRAKQVKNLQHHGYHCLGSLKKQHARTFSAHSPVHRCLALFLNNRRYCFHRFI